MRCRVFATYSGFDYRIDKLLLELSTVFHSSLFVLSLVFNVDCEALWLILVDCFLRIKYENCSFDIRM